MFITRNTSTLIHTSQDTNNLRPPIRISPNNTLREPYALKPARESDLQYANSIKPDMARNCNTTHQTAKQCLKETTIKSHKKDRERQNPHRTTRYTQRRQGGIETGANRTTSKTSETASKKTNTQDHRKLHLHSSLKQKVEAGNGDPNHQRGKPQNCSKNIENTELWSKERR